MHRQTFRILGILCLLLPLVMSGCTKEEQTIIYELPRFEDPPQEAAGFLGYDESATKLTICGNCHVGQQSGWENTGHADAWAGLQNSGRAQSFCEGCHTVSELGNEIAGSDVGWTSTADNRYLDVQCESCHAAGQAHLLNPDASQPHASIAVDLDDPAKVGTNGCGECHNGTHHPYAEEWAQSGHAAASPAILDRANDDPGRYGSCLSCHSGQGALNAWGIRANYVEKEDAILDYVGITCAVCHDPHDATFGGQLRFPVDSLDPERNLCMQCHNRRGVVDPNSSRGPHAPEGPLLIGAAGWVPPGFEYEGIVPSHGGAGNPDLCAGCHVAQYEITNPETGDFVFSASGHTFEATPCVDENGIPYIPAEGEECEDTEKSFNSCATSGCHASGDQARLTLSSTRNTLNDLIDELQGLLDQVDEAEFDSSDGVATTAEGADFNKELAQNPGSAAHNGIYVRELLRASIAQVNVEYGLNAALSFDPTPYLLASR